MIYVSWVGWFFFWFFLLAFAYMCVCVCVCERESLCARACVGYCTIGFHSTIPIKSHVLTITLVLWYRSCSSGWTYTTKRIPYTRRTTLSLVIHVGLCLMSLLSCIVLFCLLGCF